MRFDAYERVESRERVDTIVAWALFVLAFVALWLTHRAVGYPRDESFYFVAGANHGNWFELLFSNPSVALTDRSITDAFRYNYEHPGLMKNLFGISHWIFHRELGWLGAADAFRLPAFLIAALIAPVTYKLGAGLYGRAVGLFAAISFFLIPRQFYNSHLAAFDVPVAAFWLLTIYAFWRAQERPWWWLWCGVAFGLGLATKHNTFFIPLVLAPFVLYLAWKHSEGVPEARKLAWLFVGLYAGAALLYAFLVVILGERAFLPKWILLSPHSAIYLVVGVAGFVVLRRLRAVSEGTFRALAPAHAIATVGVLVLYLAWPYLWHHPVDRIATWLAFHMRHEHYAWFYLGTLLRQPPFPLSYVVVKTALTVPTSLFVPMVFGFFTLVARLFATVVPKLRAWTKSADWRDALIVANAVASILVISHPNVPHFGGVKHWFPSMPFLGIAAGVALSSATFGLWSLLRRRSERLPDWSVVAPVMLLVFLPAYVMSARIHPYGTSSYSELAGGVPGAANLGMQRQFWSSNVTGVLPWINENAPPNARVWLHEVTQYAFHDYQRNGWMRPDLRFVGHPRDADIAAYQYHQEFREHEFWIWEAFGTTRPVTGLYIDETPQVVVYRRR